MPRRSATDEIGGSAPATLAFEMRRLSPFAAVLALALFMSGCPRTPNAPDPGMGTPCEQLIDCNPTATCGALRLCVAGFCEEGNSLIRPCPDEGEPVRRIDP